VTETPFDGHRGLTIKTEDGCFKESGIMEFDSGITFLNTRNLEETSRFYEDKLGLKLALDQGGCRIFKVAARSYLGFCLRPDAPRAEGVIITLVSDDVDGWYTRLARQGITLEAEPRLNPDYHIYHFFFTDPNGYKLEIQRFEDPRWE
jgi:catechol 2,3-dioxygenase-like lactoylglutathione lyase family enzyme